MLKHNIEEFREKNKKICHYSYISFEVYKIYIYIFSKMSTLLPYQFYRILINKGPTPAGYDTRSNWTLLVPIMYYHTTGAPSY